MPRTAVDQPARAYDQQMSDSKPTVELRSLDQHPDGFWVAVLAVGADVVEASNAFGSWQTPTDHASAHNDATKARRELLPPYAKLIADALRKRKIAEQQQTARASVAESLAA
jgi:hypothetical protein